MEGDTVLLGYDNRIVEAKITLISDNGRSLIVEFDAILGGYVGTMLIFKNDDGSYRDVLAGQPVNVVVPNP